MECYFSPHFSAEMAGEHLKIYMLPIKYNITDKT